MTDQKECRECTSGYRGNKMYRAYIRKQDWTGKKKWIPIGWHCEKCKRTVPDEKED